MDYLQKEINEYLAGEISLSQLEDVLHFLIDDIVIPDAIYTKKRQIEEES
jgi:hypothetical protein